MRLHPRVALPCGYSRHDIHILIERALDQALDGIYASEEYDGPAAFLADLEAVPDAEREIPELLTYLRTKVAELPEVIR